MLSTGIRNGVPDLAEEGEQTTFDPARFVYEINYPQNGADRFLLTLDNEALLDKEGLRFGGLYGQSFIIKDGENEYKLGKLSKIEYPNVTFNLLPEDCGKIKEMAENNCIIAVIPDMDDMTGEIEKVNRLRDRSTESLSIQKIWSTLNWLPICLMLQKQPSWKIKL